MGQPPSEIFCPRTAPDQLTTIDQTQAAGADDRLTWRGVASAQAVVQPSVSSDLQADTLLTAIRSKRHQRTKPTNRQTGA